MSTVSALPWNDCHLDEMGKNVWKWGPCFLPAFIFLTPLFVRLFFVYTNYGTTHEFSDIGSQECFFFSVNFDNFLHEVIYITALYVSTLFTMTGFMFQIS